MAYRIGDTGVPFGWGGAPDPFEPNRLIADGTSACGYSSHRQGIDWNFCHFEMVAVVVAEDTTMRSTFATAILVTASLMGAVALTSAQNRAGDQEKGLLVGAAGQKISPARALGQGHQDIPQTPTQAKKLRFMTSSKLVTSPLLRRAKTLKAQRGSSHRAKHRNKRVRAAGSQCSIRGCRSA